VDRWRVVRFDLEELPPLVGSTLQFFSVVSSMCLMHPLGCILEKKSKVTCTLSIWHCRFLMNDTDNNFQIAENHILLAPIILRTVHQRIYLCNNKLIVYKHTSQSQITRTAPKRVDLPDPTSPHIVAISTDLSDLCSHEKLTDLLSVSCSPSPERFLPC
jgi:hypothetical protein